MFSYVSRTVSQLPIACAPLACRVDLRHSLRVEWKNDGLGSQPSQPSPVLHKHETCDSALCLGLLSLSLSTPRCLSRPVPRHSSATHPTYPLASTPNIPGSHTPTTCARASTAGTTRWAASHFHLDHDLARQRPETRAGRFHKYARPRPWPTTHKSVAAEHPPLAQAERVRGRRQ